jgi:predicted O-methyltransferase YrrM
MYKINETRTLGLCCSNCITFYSIGIFIKQDDKKTEFMETDMMSDTRFKFSVSWFLNTVQQWRDFLLPLKYKELNVLEIGSFEGMSAAWLLDNVLVTENSHITCVDPFLGSDEHDEKTKANLYNRFYNNIVKNFPENKVTVMKQFSNDALLELGKKNEKFDIIYIDGDHHAKQVNEDAVLSWPLLKDGGIMIFDDYMWDMNSGNPLDNPKPGIDDFLETYKNECNVLHKEYQVFIKKN